MSSVRPNDGDGERVSLSDLREDLASVLCDLRDGVRPIIVTRHGQDMAVLVSIDEYRELIALRDRLVARVGWK